MITEHLVKQKAQLVRSEIGMFPSDWPVRRLDQIAGGVSVGLVINPSTYISDQGTVPMLLGSQVTANRIDHEAAKRITPQSNAKIPASILRAGDLVTVRVGDPGTTAVIADELDGCNCASMMIIRRHSRFNSAWLSHLMNSPLGQRQVANVQYGTAQKQFNIGDAVGFLFPVPPRPEQDAIGQAISDADALIDSLEQLLTKKRQIKQGAMQELLTGKRRLPGFAGLVQTVQLGSVCKMQSGGTPAASQSVYFDGPHPWVAISDITQANKYLSTTERSLSDAGLNASAAQLFPAGTVLYAMYASVGECCIATVTSCTSQAILAMQPTKSLDSEYLYYSLVSSKAKAKSAVQQGTQGNLNKGIVQAMDIRLPEIAEQQAIARVLSEMDAEITALESRLTKARALKQAMAQALLTGKIRLI